MMINENIEDELRLDVLGKRLDKYDSLTKSEIQEVIEIARNGIERVEMLMKELEHYIVLGE